MKKKRWLACFIIAASFILVLLFLIRAQYDMADFEVNWKAGKRLLSGETLYRLEDEHYQFKYLPVAAFFYIPLSLLPLSTAKAVWFAFTSLAGGLFVFISYRLLPQKRKPAWMIMGIPVLILLRYFLRELDLGQINLVVAVTVMLMLGSFLQQTRTRKARQSGVLAGLCCGTSIALKPYSLIFFPYLLAKRKWLALVAAFAVLAVSFFLPLAFYNFKGNLLVHWEWLSTLTRSTPGLLTSADNISLAACFMKWTGSESTSLILFLFSLFLLGGLFLVFLHRGQGLRLRVYFEVSFLLLVLPLVSPLGWNYTFLLSLPALMLLVNYSQKFSRFWRGVLIINMFLTAISLYDILGKSLYSLIMEMSAPTIFFSLFAGLTSWLRLRKIC